MKKFLVKSVIYLGIVLAAVLPVNFLYMKNDKSDPDWTAKFKAVPEHVQVCNFGSSHGLFGFCYEDYDDLFDSFNFGLTAQRLTYDLRLFENYGDSIGEGTVVLIPVSYFSLIGADETEDADFLMRNRRYYSFLPPDLIKEYDLKTDIYVSYFPSLIATPKKLVLTLLGRSENTNISHWKQKFSESDMAANTANTYKVHITDRRDKTTGNWEINRKELDALYEIDRKCKEKNAIPVLITTPLSSTYLDMVKENSPEFFDRFQAIMEQVCSETETEYYNYAFDQRFYDHLDLFLDCDHLNKDGAKQYTEILMNEVVLEKMYRAGDGDQS